MTTHSAAPFSRRDLLKRGTLIVGFNLAGPLLPWLPGTTATANAS
jgi:hypothetical protein